MAISKVASGWLVDIQPGGRGGKRFRKTLATKAEALAYQAWLVEKLRVSPDWSKPGRDRRLVSKLVELWFSHHGVNLRNGEAAKVKMLNALAAMGNPGVDDFNSDLFARYRAGRLAAGVSAATLNREHAYLRAVFNELGRLGSWAGANPLSSVRQFKEAQHELSFLTLDQIRVLLGCLESAGDSLLVAQVCLATGARWSEAEGLRASQVRGCKVHFSDTKSGKNRSVPISASLEAALLAHFVARYGDDVELGSQRLFFACMERFRYAVSRSSLSLPKGQLTHVLRHTFASHFMMNGGNILVLQKVLGHSSLTMTMRYAHLSPDHLIEAVSLNPLAALTVC